MKFNYRGAWPEAALGLLIQSIISTASISLTFMIRSYRATRFMVATLAIVLACIFLVSCGSEEGFEVAPPPPRAFVRLVNAVPDSPILRFNVQNREEAALRFGEASAFRDILPDVRREFAVSFFDDQTRIQLITDEFAVEQNRRFTAIVTGTMDSPQLIFIDNDPVDVPADSNQAEIQFAHAATRAPDTMEVFVNDEGGAGADPNSVLSFGEATELQTVSASDDVEFSLRPPEATNELWSSGPFTLSAATRRLLLILDYFGPGDTNVRMLFIGENGAGQFPEESLPAAVRFANMKPDIGPLDVTIASETLLAEDIDFTGITDHLELAGGEQLLEVTPADQPDTTVFEGAFQFTKGQFLTLTFTGLGTDNEAAVSEDNSRRLSLGATFSATHASPSSEDDAFDVYLLREGEQVSDRNPDATVGFLVTGTLFSSPGTFDLALTGAGSNDIVFGPRRVDLDQSGIFKIFIRDSEGGGTPIDVIFADDFAN